MIIKDWRRKVTVTLVYFVVHHNGKNYAGCKEVEGDRQYETFEELCSHLGDVHPIMANAHIPTDLPSGWLPVAIYSCDVHIGRPKQVEKNAEVRLQEVARTWGAKCLDRLYLFNKDYGYDD